MSSYVEEIQARLLERAFDSDSESVARSLARFRDHVFGRVDPHVEIARLIAADSSVARSLATYDGRKLSMVANFAAGRHTGESEGFEMLTRVEPLPFEPVPTANRLQPLQPNRAQRRAARKRQR